MKVLVTGGAGFIGSHISDLFLSKGHQVVIVDDLSTGNLRNLNRKAKFYQLDILDKKIETVFAEEKFDAVIHEAAKLNLRESFSQPELYERVNVLGTINLLECCRKFGVKKFIYAASASRYGVPSRLPCQEQDSVDLISPYAISKYNAEKYIESYGKIYNLDYTILIYSNVYGPRQDSSKESGVISIFTNRLIKSQVPQIFGTGEQTRDYVFVEDIAQANLLALTDPRTKNNIFNVCCGNEISVNYLFHEITKLLNSNIKPEFTSKIPGEVERFFPDNTKLFKTLGWKPRTNILEGLKKTIEYYRTNR